MCTFHKLSKVSALAYFLYKVTIQRTFENVCVSLLPVLACQGDARRRPEHLLHRQRPALPREMYEQVWQSSEDLRFRVLVRVLGLG
jgi:hypothetical protein